MTRPTVDRTQRRRVRGGLSLLALLLLLGATTVGTGPVQAQVEGVDLRLTLDEVDEGRNVDGATTTLSVHIRNVGSETATGVSITWTLPAGVRSTDRYGRCTGSTGTVTCTTGEVDSQIATDFDFHFESTGTFPIAATVTADLPDADGDSSAAIDVVIVEEEADLEVLDKTEEGVAGTVHRVVHDFTNHGPTVATGSVTGTFPEGSALVPGSFASDRCTATSTDFTCPFDFLYRLRVTYDVVLPAVTGPARSTVTITGRNDPVAGNNTATHVVEVVEPSADLSVEVQSVPPAAAGGSTEVLVSVGNSGNSGAEGVVLTVQAPEGWTPGLPTSTTHSCEVVAAERATRCTYGSVGSPWVSHRLIPLTAPVDGSGTGTVVVTIETTSPEVDTRPNVATREVGYGQVGADLTVVSASHEPEPALQGRPGSTITWRFRNDTPDRLATGLRFVVNAPAGVEGIAKVDVDGAPTSCRENGSTNTCTVASPRFARDVEVRLSVEFAQPGTYTFTASASQTSPEQVPGNESLSHTVDVAPASADLQVKAVGSATEVTAGEQYSYVATVRNDGPDPATRVTVRDDFPKGTYLSSVSYGWSGNECEYGPDGWGVDYYVCTIGTLAPGASTFVRVTLVAGSEPGPVTNTVSVTGGRPDPRWLSNRARVTVEVVEPGSESPVDLALTRRPDPDPLVAGEPVDDVYTIENRSGRAATGVVLDVGGGADTNLEILDASYGWFGRACGTTATATCTIPTIPAGGSEFVVVRARPLEPGELDTTASVTADQPDPAPADNTVAVTGTVAAPK